MSQLGRSSPQRVRANARTTPTARKALRGGSGLRHGSQPHACRLGPGSQLLVPHGEERLGCSYCEQAGQVHRVCASQGVSTGQVTGMCGDGFGQLDRPCCRPEVLPQHFGMPLFGRVQAVSAPSCGQRGTHLWIRETAGHCRIAAVPQRGGNLAPVLFDDQLDESTAVEIHDGHERQRRCSLTSPDTGPLACALATPRAAGRSSRRALLITPLAMSWSSSGAVSTASKRATGVPRSVTTISSPERARSIHVDSSARKVLIATSIYQMYNSSIEICTTSRGQRTDPVVSAWVEPWPLQ